jgi:hypothetical protein
MTGRNIIKSFKRKGNSIIGVGAYSAAISCQDLNYIIKVGSSTSDPWLDYYSMVITELPDNPHIPFVKKLHQDNTYNYYIAIVERLDPNVSRDLVDLLKEYCESMYTDEEMLENLLNYKTEVPNPAKMLKLLSKIKEHTTHFNADDLDEDEDEYNSRKLDLHRGNLMMRDGVIVVIDPWCDVDMTDVDCLCDWAETNL